MAQGGDEWELSKENVQPLRQGRIMSTLQGALAQQETTSYSTIQQQKQAFESEIRFYTGDDPLDVWDRYIRWIEQTFPQGGKESKLSALLERAVKVLQEERRYYNDPRFLSLWLKLGHTCNEPLDMYSYLHSQGIGIGLAQLYIAWAEAYEVREDYRKAEQVFQKGLQCKAEPQDRLQSQHRQFQARVSRQTLWALERGGEEEEEEVEEVEDWALGPHRTSLAELKSRGKKTARAPINRVGGALRGQSRGLPNTAPPQRPNGSQFMVFDENGGGPSWTEPPGLSTQPWAAPPVPRDKENELKPGPWNNARLPEPPRWSAASVAAAAPALPGFTPYVEESAQQQVMTPCKIEPSINHVLSTWKPGKEAGDALQRVQSHQKEAHEKKEVVMYCKEKVYASVEEFSLEEIRAEIWWKKLNKKRDEELLAREHKRAEMQKQIEQMEQLLKEIKATQEQRPGDELAVRELIQKASSLGPAPEPQETPEDTVPASTQYPEGAPAEQLFGPQRASLQTDNGRQNWPCPLGADPLDSGGSGVPFSIFDESEAGNNPCASLPANPQQLPTRRRPLAVRRHSEGIASKDDGTPEATGELVGVEPLSEEAIITGSYRNVTICPDPEDTCDFLQAAHLASTPFHGVVALNGPLAGDAKRVPQEAVGSHAVREATYPEELTNKKLSPIMEESSQEMTRSSGALGSSSSSVSGLSTIKDLQIPEKLELANETEGAVSSSVLQAETSPPSPWCPEQHRRLLVSLPELSSFPGFCSEPGPMPEVEVDKVVKLGKESYCIKKAVLTGDACKTFWGVQIDSSCVALKAVAIKVYSQPAPWDFYITVRLKERLEAEFGWGFSERCSCLHFQDGCIVLHQDLNPFTLSDLLPHTESNAHELALLVAHTLLGLVEKLQRADIVHGDLSPQTLILGDRICAGFHCAEDSSVLRIVDFSHAVDLRARPGIRSLGGFPTVQALEGQKILAHCTSPYQVDLLGIADVAHLLLFREHLQVRQAGSHWTLSQNLSGLKGGGLWKAFFERILNADGEASVSVVSELRQGLNEKLDSCWSSLQAAFWELEGLLS
ncbi:mitotic checkpoint serine/threonine-protein kinase BUB1 beta [Ornithorhynchus anatinus]|uniref:BUB1 mitotic checkpoint serine/threonine kinase B n=1 Tax=Ornithorhynchus anatinus TaxID=9258 RepID=F6RG50_ORNAN|nr:mitotic checkpoint serine/threonine-protein kinase BUB1 beta [Ornithorhynchus anatinus]XP_007659319.2 mitotic checkpoint serine/threonine-protein kinase BUB1 beta [Ornithorhynchus anatinus]